jgi:Phage tail lysozyme
MSIEAVEINANVQESYSFWKSKGFSHEQAAGIVANEHKESRCNPKAV